MNTDPSDIQLQFGQKVVIVGRSNSIHAGDLSLRSSIFFLLLSHYCTSRVVSPKGLGSESSPSHSSMQFKHSKEYNSNFVGRALISMFYVLTCSDTMLDTTQSEESPTIRSPRLVPPSPCPLWKPHTFPWKKTRKIYVGLEPNQWRANPFAFCEEKCSRIRMEGALVRAKND